MIEQERIAVAGSIDLVHCFTVEYLFELSCTANLVRCSVNVAATFQSLRSVALSETKSDNSRENSSLEMLKF